MPFAFHFVWLLATLVILGLVFGPIVLVLVVVARASRPQPPPPPQLSPDGRWWWDGVRWVPAGERRESSIS